MFDWLLPETHAISILKRDHDRVKELFNEFEKAETRPAKRKTVEQALQELKMHATLEEEIFYPAVRRHVGGDLMNEADEEHHVAKLLIAELETMSESDDHHDARFTVLAENVRHHIKEEENEVMPKARGANLDFERLGRELLKRKKELLDHGIPAAAEEKLISSNPLADSPAEAAKAPPARAVAAIAAPAKAARTKTSHAKTSSPKKAAARKKRASASSRASHVVHKRTAKK